MDHPSVTAHPAVARYLDELERLLHGVDPVERTEVLDGVREHLEASLHGTSGGDADVRAALDEIGPPQAVADEAYAGPSGVALAPPAPAPTPPGPVPVTSRGWVPATVAVLSGLALLQVVVAVLADVSSSGGSIETTGPNGRIVELEPMAPAAPEISLAFFSLLGALPFWLPLAVIVGSSALWRSREKSLLIGLAPLAVLLVTALPWAAQTLLGVGGSAAGGRLALGVVVLGGVSTVAVLVRRGSRRVPRPGPTPPTRLTRSAPTSSRGWLPASVALLQVVALMLVLMIATSAGELSGSSGASYSADGELIRRFDNTTYDGSALTGLGALMAGFPAWLPLVLLVTASTLWSRRERWLLVLVVPVAAFLLGSLPAIGWTAFGEDGVYGAVWLGQLVGLFGGVTVTAVLVRRALVRAAALRAR